MYIISIQALDLFHQKSVFENNLFEKDHFVEHSLLRQDTIFITKFDGLLNSDHCKRNESETIATALLDALVVVASR